MNMKNNSTYWQGDKPKDTKELQKQINRAILALRQWIDAANIDNAEDSAMIEAQLFWLEELLKISQIKLKT